MLQRNGLYLHHGPENHALAVIVEGGGRTIWVRDFVNSEYALNVPEDEVLEDYDRGAIEGTLNRHKAYFTEIEPREDGYKDHAFKKYVLAELDS
jgi:hypothetical protein